MVCHDPEQVHSRPQSGRAYEKIVKQFTSRTNVIVRHGSKRQKLKRKRTFSKKKTNPGDSSTTQPAGLGLVKRPMPFSPDLKVGDSSLGDYVDGCDGMSL